MMAMVAPACRSLLAANRPGRSVTFPARQFIVHGDRRNFALLRGISDPTVQNRVRELLLRAYDEQTSEPVRAAS
jgi:hypothetical protein